MHITKFNGLRSNTSLNLHTTTHKQAFAGASLTGCTHPNLKHMLAEAVWPVASRLFILVDMICLFFFEKLCKNNNSRNFVCYLDVTVFFWGGGVYMDAVYSWLELEVTVYFWTGLHGCCLFLDIIWTPLFISGRCLDGCCLFLVGIWRLLYAQISINTNKHQ